jgi:hypothetical protein
MTLADCRAETVGLPDVLIMDNGPDFSGRPGKAVENAVVESFNRRCRHDCLNEHCLASVADHNDQAKDVL